MQKHSFMEQDLLQCFFSECEEQFDFLEKRHGFKGFSGWVEYRKNYKVVKPYQSGLRPTSAVDQQLVSCMYERLDHVIEITFSSENLAIEGYIYFDPVQRFEFSEVLTAAKKNAPNIVGDSGLSNPALIKTAISRMASDLRKHKRYFLNPSEKLIDRAHIIRSKRIEQAVRQHFDALMEQACKEAARAFANQDFKTVVKALQPYEVYLSNADIKKLTLARKSLLIEKSE